jgi:predicted  nucleic acid-binding Zn-ribbon protein
MENLQINVYAFLGVLEFSLLLLVVTLFFTVRSKNLAGRLRVVQEKLNKAEQLPEPVTFDQYLRDEVIHNQHLIERAAASQEDAEKKVAEVMNVRKQFLELEVEARALENNPIAFQDKLADGLSELIERLRPEAEIVMGPVVEAVETIPQLEKAAAEQRKLIETHDAEFERLKEVINNQQDAMEALRKAEDDSSAQDEKHELEIKLQELEALVEFKDATIEELEKQYSKLEARFLAVSGEKKVN